MEAATENGGKPPSLSSNDSAEANKAMNGLPTEWRPLSLDELQKEMTGFEDWVLCGGHSVALAVGNDSRPHGDIDIGVFRSQLLECLGLIGRNRVFLCRNGGHEGWDGKAIPEEVHDIWIRSRDGQTWAFQVMVYDDDGEEVVYRRDRRIRWPKHAHACHAGRIKFLNPLVTALFKAQSHSLREKDVHDLRELISNWPNKSPQPTPGSVTRRATESPNPKPHESGTPRASSLRG